MSAAENMHPTSTEPEVLTVEETAALLRVSRATVYTMVQSGEIPAVRRFRGAIRFHRATLLSWLAKGQESDSRRRR